jgi:uncharacterized protein (TIGR03067 family)
MRRRILYSLCAGLLVVIGLGSDSPKQYDDATDGDELQGRWEFVLRVYDHRQSIAPAVEGSEVETFLDHRWKRDGGKWSVVYKTDARQRPAHLDTHFTSGDGRRGTMRYIYRRDGDKLQIAFMDNVSVRPLSFDEPGIFVTTYRRAK